MKIERVEGILLTVPLSPENVIRFSGGQITNAHAALVKIHTDSGITGLGDTYAGGWYYPTAAKALLEHFDQFLLGQDPLEVGRISHDLWMKSQYWGRAGAAVNAISAIETALWDIAGKEAGVPVWKLLGGLAHRQLPLYASAGNERPRNETVTEMNGYLEAGYGAVKIRVLTDLHLAIEKVKLCRETLGSGIRLMVDAVMGCHPRPWSSKEAIRFAKAIERYDVAWLEEPCAAYDLEGNAAVRRATTIPISGGETSHTIHEYRRFFESGALDIVQPDACTSGGLLECQRIAALASAHHVRVAPHAWGTGISVMANLHWAFTVPNVFIQEYPTWGFPLRDELLVKPLAINDGMIAPPTAPGLGVELHPETCERYPWTGSPAASLEGA